MASKSNKEMSEWIKFFTAAGIPPGPAAKYAMAFIDNRIQKSMLMDLTKEYLKDMGVSVMGDVICILKHAKSAHSQYERERPLLEAMPQPEDGKIELKRQTTPGNRMLEHYMRKEGIMEENTKVKVSTAMATRLGAVPTLGTKKKLVGVPDSVEVIPVKKPRRVPPEEEGAYIITLPKGSTERTKKILGQKAQDAKSSVFSRLGSTGSLESDELMKTKAKPPASAKETGSPTVFNRLGSQTTKPSTATSVLQYQGVLKSSPKSSPTPKILTRAAVPKAKTTASSGVQERLGVQRPEVSTTTITHMDSIGLKHSLQARLGSQKSDAAVLASQKKKIVISKDSAASTGKKTASGVLARLGAQRVDTQAATKPEQSSATLKPSLTKRLGTQKASVRISLKPGAKPGAKPGVKPGVKPGAKPGVMARLGQKQKSSPTKASIIQLGKVQSRLGLPVKNTESPVASLITERLGPQKAEASSTTPTFTVTLGATASPSKPTGSTRKRKRKPAGISEDTSGRSVTMGQDVFSRLGSEAAL